VGKNDKKISKAERRKKTVRLIQAIIVMIIVVGMIVTGLLASFLK
jgi:hypothetical protein